MKCYVHGVLNFKTLSKSRVRKKKKPTGLSACQVVERVLAKDRDQLLPFFRPQVELCLPCNRLGDLDFVGKLETYKRDVTFLGKVLELDVSQLSDDFLHLLSFFPLA